jgi:hypothetical protein
LFFSADVRKGLLGGSIALVLLISLVCVLVCTLHPRFSSRRVTQQSNIEAGHATDVQPPPPPDDNSNNDVNKRQQPQQQEQQQQVLDVEPNHHQQQNGQNQVEQNAAHLDQIQQNDGQPNNLQLESQQAPTLPHQRPVREAPPPPPKNQVKQNAAHLNQIQQNDGQPNNLQLENKQAPTLQHQRRVREAPPPPPPRQHTNFVGGQRFAGDAATAAARAALARLAHPHPDMTPRWVRQQGNDSQQTSSPDSVVSIDENNMSPRQGYYDGGPDNMNDIYHALAEALRERLNNVNSEESVEMHVMPTQPPQMHVKNENTDTPPPVMSPQGACSQALMDSTKQPTRTGTYDDISLNSLYSNFNTLSHHGSSTTWSGTDESR